MISVGIDIGSYSIKVAEVEATSKGFVVRSVQEFPLSLDLTKDKKIEIIDTLRTLFAQYNFEETEFVFGVPERHVSMRAFNLPFRERFKIQKAIISQLEDELPLTLEDAIFDVKITRYTGKGADVLALAVPKERVSETLDLAHDCGVDPKLISAEGLGLSNVFEPWDQSPPETLPTEQDIPASKPADLVLNIGHTHTQLLVYFDNRLLAVRNIEWGARQMANAIGAKYGLNYLQAMRELQTKGFILVDKAQAQRDQGAFSDVIAASLDPLIAELRLKMLDLQSELNVQWTKGFLLGGVSQLKNLGAFLTQQFQVPFNRYKTFEHLPVRFESSVHLDMVSGVAVGLALEGLKRPRNPAINLMKGDFAPQSNWVNTFWERWGYTAQLLTAAFFGLLVYGMMRESLSTRLTEESDVVLRNQAEAIAGLKGRQATPSRIEKFISTQEKLSKARKQAEKVVRINSALDILDLVSAAMPSRESINLELKRVVIDGTSAEVQGYTNTPREKEQVQQALQRVSQNGKVEVSNLRIPVPAGRTGFAYRFPIQRVSGG